MTRTFSISKTYDIFLNLQDGSSSQQQHKQQQHQQILLLDNPTTEPTSSQQQQQQQQVHTIMLNGQPALFIPTSSAISMNLMGQMQMQMQNSLGGTSSIEQSVSSASSTANTLELPTVDFSSLLANQLMMPIMPEGKTPNKERFVSCHSQV